MKTASLIVAGNMVTSLVAHCLINQSRWFELTPLPFDKFEFRVKSTKTSFAWRPTWP